MGRVVHVQKLSPKVTEWAQWPRSGQVVTVAPEHPPWTGTPGEASQERGLSDPRFAGDQHNRSPSLSGLLARITQSGQWTFSLEQLHPSQPISVAAGTGWGYLAAPTNPRWG